MNSYRLLCVLCARTTLTLSDKPIELIDKYLIKHSAEEWIELTESKYKLGNLRYTTFLYDVKRYGYKDIPFDDNIFGILCKHLHLNHTEFDHEREEDRDKDLAQVFKCSNLFHKGCYNVKNLCILGLMYCKHQSLAAKKEELWCLANHEIKPFISKEELSEVFETMVYFAIGLRLEIELRKKVYDQR